MSDNSVERILAILDQINAVPRQSHHLERIHPWLMSWGKDHGFDVDTDEARNVLIRVPATPGYDKAPVIVLQGHMDMVCEKRPDVEHDFQKDPIVSWRDGDWLRAQGTSLGADNAVALAMFFTLVTDPHAEHPELEILITSDEETGLVGAQKLQPGFLKGSVLLNVDSEDEGVFTIGCAGGMDTNLMLPVSRDALPAGYTVRRVKVGGLEGGHSGIEIHVGKANANVVLARAMRTLLDAIPEARVGELKGGTAHNAIPREAEGLIALPFGRLGELEELITGLEATLKIEYEAIEKKLFLALETALAPANGLFIPEDGLRVIDVLRLIPHGVKAMSTKIDGVVDTSMNFAILRTGEKGVKVLTNRRSSVMSRGADFSETIFGLARLYGGHYDTGNHYPPWEPRTDSDILHRCRQVWHHLHNREPVVEVTHAGLECGAIATRYPEMEMISFGPTILQPHSPDERLYIPSLGRVQTFFQELLKSYR